MDLTYIIVGAVLVLVGVAMTTVSRRGDVRIGGPLSYGPWPFGSAPYPKAGAGAEGFEGGGGGGGGGDDSGNADNGDGGASQEAPAPDSAFPEYSPAMAEAEEKYQQSDLLRQIQAVVRNEIAASRQMGGVGPVGGGGGASAPTSSLAQGTEWSCKRPRFDPTKYIRKDEIPCWGCVVP